MDDLELFSRLVHEASRVLERLKDAQEERDAARKALEVERIVVEQQRILILELDEKLKEVQSKNA